MLVRDPREISDSIVSAVLDFCRRADRPTTAEEVRLALARLGSDREREILRLAASEPPARPLSPHAFVDWIQGMPPAQAAALEEAGAYQAIAREAAAQAIDLQLRLDRAAKVEKKVRPTTKRRKKADETPAGPIVRRRPRPEPPAEATAETGTGEREPESPPSPPVRPGRRPAEPRFGRFVSGPPAKRPIAELEGPEGGEILRGLIAETHGNPSLLLDRLNAAWAPPQGTIGRARLEELLERHGLAAVRRKAEREQLRALLRRQRGFDRPVARAWRISTADLRRLVAEYGLAEELEELRRRAREEVLAEERLEARLDLLFRQADRLHALGAHREIHEKVREELTRRVEQTPVEGKPETPEVLLELVRRQEGLDRAAWRWAVDRFGLLGLAARRLGIPLAPGPERRWGESRAPFPHRAPRGARPRPFKRDRGSR